VAVDGVEGGEALGHRAGVPSQMVAAVDGRTEGEATQWCRSTNDSSAFVELGQV